MPLILTLGVTISNSTSRNVYIQLSFDVKFMTTCTFSSIHSGNVVNNVQSAKKLNLPQNKSLPAGSVRLNTACL